MRVTRQKLLAFRPERIVATEPDEQYGQDYGISLPNLNINHLTQNCPCFKCTCGRCRCDFAASKPNTRMPNTTYRRQFIKKDNVEEMKAFNCEDWRFKSLFNLPTNTDQKLNRSVDQASCRPKMVINPGNDFGAIFNILDSSKQTSYQSQFKAHDPEQMVTMIKPKNNINVHHDMQHFYLMQRSQNQNQQVKGEQFENFKEMLTKPNVRNRNLSFSNESTYRFQYPRYAAPYANQVDTSYRAKYLETKDHQNRFITTFQQEYQEKQPSICQAKVELDIIKASKKMINGRYYLQEQTK